MGSVLRSILPCDAFCSVMCSASVAFLCETYVLCGKGLELLQGTRNRVYRKAHKERKETAGPHSTPVFAERQKLLIAENAENSRRERRELPHTSGWVKHRSFNRRKLREHSPLAENSLARY